MVQHRCLGQEPALRFRVTGVDGFSVDVDAPNWMVAFGEQMARAGVRPAELARWRCLALGDGQVRVSDPGSGDVWEIRPLDPQDAPRLPTESGPPPRRAHRRVRAARPEQPVPGPLQTLPEFELEPLYTEETTAVKIFEWSRTILGRPPQEACRLALKLALKFVPAEAGSVYRSAVDEVGLQIVAATGPVGPLLVGRTVPLGRGLVGLCYDLAIPLMLRDASQHPRHFARFDEELAFHTRGLLAVPVMGRQGAVGVVQVLNPERDFEQGDIDVLDAVASILASALGE